MRLYAIKPKDSLKDIEIFEVSTIKETEKYFRIDDNRIYKTMLSKKDLYVKYYNGMFGTDKELLIKRWNEEVDLEISECEYKRVFR